MAERREPVTEQVDPQQLAKELLAQAKQHRVELVGPKGLLNQLTVRVLEPPWRWR